MKITHIIVSLENHGAQNFLLNLICADKENEHNVICLSEKLDLINKYKCKNIKINIINLNSFILFVPNIIKLITVLNKSKNNIIQSWLYHSDFILGFLSLFIKFNKSIWTIRGSFDKSNEKIITKLIVYLNSFLSKFSPTIIIYNSFYSQKIHETLGYDKRKSIVIYNGFNTDKYKFSDKNRSITLKKLNLNSNDLIIGLVGRFDPHKNHKAFIKIIDQYKKINSNFKCILIGENIKDNSFLETELDQYNLRDYFMLLEQSYNIESIYSTLDIHILTSHSESFPNVVFESLACGGFNISSNVSDLKKIFQDKIYIYEKNEYNLVANEIYKLYRKKKSQGYLFRNNDMIKFVHSNFSINNCLSKYKNIWKK